MATYFKKRQARHEGLIDEYYQRLNDAEKYQQKENAAAMVIQKCWVMFKTKWNYDDKQRSCRRVQRIWRGYLGRCKFMERKQAENEYKQSKFFNE